MEIKSNYSENNLKLYNDIVLREKMEKRVTGAITTEILMKLKVFIDSLPQKLQLLFHHVAMTQLDLDLEILDSAAISLRRSRDESEQLDEEYEILKLKQKNKEVQAKIDRNREFLEGLRRELNSSKDSLAKRDPNPDNVQDYIRQLKQKLRSYEETCEKAKTKFSKLSVSESVFPSSLASLLATREALRREAESLRLRAEDVTLARQARDAFNRLRK